MKKNKIYALALAVLLSLTTLTALTGCKPKSTGTTSSTASASSETPKKAKSGQLKDVFDKTITAVFGDEGPSFTPMEDADALKEMTGIDVKNEAIKEFLYEMPMINVQFQIFFGVEANEGKVAEAEKIVKDYQAKVLADKEAFPYVDAGLEKAKGAQVITVDNYVFYICVANIGMEEADISQANVDAQIKKACDAAKAALVLE